MEGGYKINEAESRERFVEGMKIAIDRLKQLSMTKNDPFDLLQHQLQTFLYNGIKLFDRKPMTQTELNQFLYHDYLETVEQIESGKVPLITGPE